MSVLAQPAQCERPGNVGVVLDATSAAVLSVQRQPAQKSTVASEGGLEEVSAFVNSSGKSNPARQAAHELDSAIEALNPAMEKVQEKLKAAKEQSKEWSEEQPKIMQNEIKKMRKAVEKTVKYLKAQHDNVKEEVKKKPAEVLAKHKGVDADSHVERLLNGKAEDPVPSDEEPEHNGTHS